ncbi:MAG: NAD(P) transhydrogenase subunit beta [Phycisphaerae bacterium]|nr:NAD(P) transhydrogenase subunit beta [Phycisphaerae bacterium]
MLSENWQNVVFLVASVLFLYGLKGLTHPRKAVRGNLMSSVAMLLAILAVLLGKNPVAEGGGPVIDSSHWWVVLVALLVGSVVGSVLALKIQMTAMPQMVGLLNGFGGLASMLVAAAEMFDKADGIQRGIDVGYLSHADILPFTTATMLAGLIGAVTFTGSLVAFGKLQGIVKDSWSRIPARQFITIGLLAASVVFAVLGMFIPWNTFYWILCVFSLALGVMLVLPIGGADMPVVIALLNSYSGLAACATGFVIENTVLIIAGSLVGASGIILTQIMCKAMNRSLTNVLFGGLGTGTPVAGPSADEVYGGKIKATSAEEIAMLFDGAQRVVFVPGYGMAVAQCQHAVRDLGKMLEEKGIEVEYAIHPVAGRMPGHMNVLLAEADVPYDKLKEMDEINPTFPQTDVAIVIGANDVVNPVARTDPKSPIAGMPILDVDKARTVVMIKRSLSPGFAGIPNPLFAADNCLMYFADGKKAILDIVAAVKQG